MSEETSEWANWVEPTVPSAEPEPAVKKAAKKVPADLEDVALANWWDSWDNTDTAWSSKEAKAPLSDSAEPRKQKTKKVVEAEAETWTSDASEWAESAPTLKAKRADGVATGAWDPESPQTLKGLKRMARASAAKEAKTAKKGEWGDWEQWQDVQWGEGDGVDGRWTAPDKEGAPGWVSLPSERPPWQRGGNADQVAMFAVSARPLPMACDLAPTLGASKVDASPSLVLHSTASDFECVGPAKCWCPCHQALHRPQGLMPVGPPKPILKVPSSAQGACLIS